MNPSRELDGRVHEIVFGEEVEWKISISHGFGEKTITPRGHTQPCFSKDGLYLPVAWYSESDSAAIHICNEFAKCDYGFFRVQYQDKHRMYECWLGDGNTKEGYSQGSSMALSICAAVLDLKPIR